MLVHDLRSPLTMIQGTLQTLSDATIPASEETRQVALELSLKHTERLLERVASILKLEQLKSGKLELRRSRCDLRELVTEAVDVGRPVAESRSQRLLTELPAVLPHVDVDRELISRAVGNLIDNALKFSPEASRVRVEVQDDPPAQVVRVEVSDEGPGVDEALKPRVFEEFVTGDTHDRGSGLGLAFCRLVIEAHDGRIGVHSEPGTGARFWFTLPVAAARDEPDSV
jgi:signal transduction histidine kinase